MNGGPSGFHNTPVTKTFISTLALLTVFLGIQGHSFSLGLSYQDIFRKLQLWRIILSAFTFASTPELMFGLYLLYYFRVFERQIGSNKYSVFILFSLIITSLLEILALALLKDPTISMLASGLQLLWSSWKRSLLPGICGLLAGSLYHLNVLHIRRIKFPQFIASFFSWLSWPSWGGSSSAATSGNVLGSVPSYANQQPEHDYTISSPATSVAEPPEDSISTLVSMGFDRNLARQALAQTGNDVNMATNILLEIQSL